MIIDFAKFKAVADKNDITTEFLSRVVCEHLVFEGVESVERAVSIDDRNYIVTMSAIRQFDGS